MELIQDWDVQPLLWNKQNLITTDHMFFAQQSIVLGSALKCFSRYVFFSKPQKDTYKL